MGGWCLPTLTFQGSCMQHHMQRHASCKDSSWDAVAEPGSSLWGVWSWLCTTKQPWQSIWMQRFYGPDQLSIGWGPCLNEPVSVRIRLAISPLQPILPHRIQHLGRVPHTAQGGTQMDEAVVDVPGDRHMQCTHAIDID